MHPISAPKGTNDLLPADSTAWEWLHTHHREVAASFGYRFLETPIFEKTEMFERGSGAGTDVVEKEMYSFIDKGGDDLTLRPEGTPSVVRAVLGAHLDQEIRPVRVRYAGPMFRRSQPQHLRYRQFRQVGIEAIGERSPSLDVEVIEVASQFFASLHLDGVRLVINTLGDIDDRRGYREALVAYYTPLVDELCDDCKRRLAINPLRLLDCKEDVVHVAGAPLLHDSLSAENRAYFDEVQGLLRDASIAFEVNQRLVRGLDYYAHTTFEFWHDSLQGAQNALGGGGRYDGLAEVLGFAATPGVGYALGVERILDVAKKSGVAPVPSRSCDVVVAPLSAAQVAHAAAVARHLRADGIATVLDASSRKLDKKLRDAERQGAAVVAIVGEDEVVEKMVSLRHLATKRQQRVEAHAAPAAVRSLAAGDDDDGLGAE